MPTPWVLCQVWDADTDHNIRVYVGFRISPALESLQSTSAFLLGSA